MGPSFSGKVREEPQRRERKRGEKLRGQGYPLLHASNEHRFVMRARRVPGCSLPILLRPSIERAQKIMRLDLVPLKQGDSPEFPIPSALT